MNVSRLSAVPKVAAMPSPTPAQALNTLWFRLSQAQAVAQCIPDKCESTWELEGAVTALAQVMALAGAVSELLALALGDTQALEALV